MSLVYAWRLSGRGGDWCDSGTMEKQKDTAGVVSSVWIMKVSLRLRDLGEMEIIKGEKGNATAVNNNKKGCKILIQEFGA